ncbi:MAG: hypothetical protein ACLR1T_11600 [Evtepia gabavorous]
MVQIETLPNGVRIVTEPMDTVRSAALGIWVGGGSRRRPRRSPARRILLSTCSSKGPSAVPPRTLPGKPTPSAAR